MGWSWKPMCFHIGSFAKIHWKCSVPFPKPFLREWLSCVHSVYPFQRPIGTTAETFIQVQSSYAGQKLILGINVWTWVSGQQQQQTYLPLKVVQTKVRTPLPLANYTLWLWNSDISDLHPCTWPAPAAGLMVVSVLPVEMYSRPGGTVFKPWRHMNNSFKLLLSLL